MVLKNPYKKLVNVYDYYICAHINSLYKYIAQKQICIL